MTGTKAGIERSREVTQVLTPRLPRCPLCGSEFERKFVVIDSPFRCPTCDRYLCVSHGYPRLQILAAMGISALICFLFGARGATLALATILAWLPIMFLVVFWTMHFAPPKLTSCQPPNSGTLGLSEGQDDANNKTR